MRAPSIITYCLCLSTFFSFAQQNDKKLVNLMKTGDSLSKVRSFKQAISYYQDAEKLAESLADSSRLNVIYSKIGRRYRYLGNMTDAIVYYKKSEKLSQSLNNRSMYSRTLGELGKLYSSNLQFDKAIEYYKEALNIQQEIGDKVAEVVTLNAIAAAYFRNNDIDNSLAFSRRSLSKAREINNPNFIAANLNAIGIYLYEKEAYREALNYREEALEICKKNNLDIPAQLMANIGTNYRSLKKIDSALVFYGEAKRIAINNNDSLSVAMVDYNLGEMHHDLKDYKISLEYFTKSYEYAQKINHIFLLMVSTDYLSKVYDNLRKPSKALQFLREHVRWKENINKEAVDKKLEEFGIEYDVTEKEEEIIELGSKVMLQQKQKLWLIFVSIILILLIIGILVWQNINKKRLLAQQQSLRLKSIIETEQKERKRIARDLHDSLGQSISTLKIQGSTLQPLPEDTSKHEKLLEQMDHVYDELRHISHNIMPNTLITLGFIPAIKELITDIASEDTPKIQLEHNDDFKTLNESQAISLYRIIQEALVNILKHAEATLVIINLEKKQGIISLHIKDNGKGMDVSKLHNHSGMGWKNIYSRVALLSAKIAVTSKPSKGTSINIQLKDE